VLEMSSWLGNIQIPVADFYDQLLYRHYGKMYESSYEGIALRVYKWADKYYVEEVK